MSEEREPYEVIEQMWGKIPPVPDGQACELENCPVNDDWDDQMADIDGTLLGWLLGDNPQQPPHLAETQFVRFENKHACYIYVCDRAAEERGVDDFDTDWPEVDGMPVEPTRCG